MLDTTLRGRLLGIGMHPRLAHEMTRQIRDVYYPAAVVAIAGAQGKGPLAGLGCGCMGGDGGNCGGALGALGLSQSAGSTMSYASKGATVGSAFPVVGTAIGAAIGVAVAALIHVLGNHDVRVSPQDMNMCAGMLKQYTDAANQAQGAPIGAQMGLDSLEKLNWCIAALYGKPVNNVDYRYFPIGWQQTTNFVQALVTGAFKQAPGTILAVPAITGYTTDRKHSNTRPATQVRLPNPLTLEGLASLVTPYMIASCSDGNKSAANCPAFWNNAYAQRMLYDLTGYWVNKLHPEVFAPPKVTPTAAVVAAAKKVVATVTGKPAVSPSATVLPAKTPSGAVIVVPAAVAANPAAAAVYTQLAEQGVDMNSSQAQQIVADVAAEGVTGTAAGPKSSMASFGTIGGVLLALVAGGMLLNRGKSGGSRRGARSRLGV